MKNHYSSTLIDNQVVVLRGVGRMYYESGLPIVFQIDELKKRGIKVSMLHVADELLKENWSVKRIMNTLTEDKILSEENTIEIQKFCYADYETQRSLIFKSLYVTRENGLKHLRTIIKNKSL